MKLTRGTALLIALAAIAIGTAIHSQLSLRTATPVVENTGTVAVSPPAGYNDIAEAYGKLPINFEPNVGQTGDAVDFLARGNGYSLFLTGSEAVLALNPRGDSGRAAAITMSLPGANENASASGINETKGKTNYFIGSDPEKWRTNVANFAKVRYDSVYKGIDLVYYGNGQQLEYDFHVAPNTDPDQIKLNFSGITDADIEKETGDLLLKTAGGTMRQHKPIVYQEMNGGRAEVASAYKIERTSDGEARVAFELGEYDRSKELVIDPILTYGTYLGGNAFDQGNSIAADADGNAYIVGTAASLNFPTTPGTIKPTLLPTTSGTQYWYDAFVTKLNPTGTAIIFSTYFGGRQGNESGGGVAVDPQGNVIFSGTTMANDMPVVSAYQSTFGGTDDAFAAKLNSTGSALIYSTYLGGNNTDTGGRIALNTSTGDTVFTGGASSPNFPTTAGVIKERLCTGGTSCNGIFYSGSYLVKLTSAGNVIYSTLFDAAINDVALDASENATIGGSAGAGFPTTSGSYQPVSSGGADGLVAKVNPSGSAITFGTYLGGGIQSDRITGIVLDSSGNMYVTGRTENTGFPTTAGVYDRTFNGQEDAFVTKFNAAGSALVYSTFLGAAGKDQPFAIGIGSANDVFITGETTSGVSFPLRNSLNGTNGNIFLTRFTPTASDLVYSTYLGVGGGYDLAIDAADNAYVTGQTTNILVTPNAVQTVRNQDPTNLTDKDGFAVKIAPTNEQGAMFAISGTVTDQNPQVPGFNWPIVATVTGTVTRSVNLPYSGGNYAFNNLPAGGNYTITITKAGFEVAPQNAVFNNLQANQFADFTVLRNEQAEGVITSPTHGQVFNAPATVHITATASDPDGDAITKVDFVAYHSQLGSIPLGTDTTAPYEFTWNNVGVGTWSIYAYPTDSKGLRGISTPTTHITVVDPAPPEVAIVAPTAGQTFTEGDNVPLAVQVSSSITRVEIRDQNFNIIGGMNGSPWTSQWRAHTVGTYTLTARAWNAQNVRVDSAPVTITVNPINHRISGRARDNITFAPIPNVTVNLVSQTNPAITATTTTDAKGEYSFTNLGTTPNDGVIITPSHPGYTFEPQNITIHFLGYIEWMNQNFTATANTGISLALTTPTEGQIFTAPATIPLAANASSTAGTITKVEFYQARGVVETLVDTDTAAPYEAQHTGVPERSSYYYFARATDSTGAVKESERVRVQVNPPVTTVRLQGRISNPGGSDMAGITVVLSGTANGNPVNQTSISNFFGSYGFFNLPSGGNYTITPQASGAMTFTPTSRSFTNVTTDDLDVDFVSSTFNTAPTVQISSPADGAVFTMPDAIRVMASASDADGTISRLTVTAVSPTRSYTLGQTLNGTFDAPWQPVEPGAYTIWATAVDNGGLIAQTSLNITVNQPAPVSISGRIVDRNSQGIEGVTVTVKNYPVEDTVIATVTTNANGNYTVPNLPTFNSYILYPEKQDHTFSPQRRIYTNLTATQTNGDFTGTQQTQLADFDGDGENDISVWRPSDGVWHITRSNDNSYTALQFGGGQFGDVPAPGNFDGDKKTDYAVFRNGTWFILNSSNGHVRGQHFGTKGDKPVAGDYDGDGKTDIAVWRPSDGVWYITRSLDGQYDFRHFGQFGDIPLAGDYDGDGIADLTVFRPSEGNWYTLRSSDGQFYAAHFGMNGDMPVVGDFDGDKKCDFTVFRPSEGNWYSLKSSDGGFLSMHWGNSSDTPVPGDYDRDGKTDFAVFRPSEGNWYIYLSGSQAFRALHFGSPGDVPVPAAYIR